MSRGFDDSGRKEEILASLTSAPTLGQVSSLLVHLHYISAQLASPSSWPL